MVPIAVELATGYVSLSVSAKGLGDEISKGFGNDLDKHANDAGDRAGKGFSDKFKVGLGGAAAAVGGVFAGGALVGFGASMNTLGLELDVLDKKTTTVFEGSADTVRKWADKNNEAMGLSDEKLAGLAAGFGDLLKPMGFTAEQAAVMSTETLDLAGALSAWSGGEKSAAEVSDILAGAMLGETDALKSLGISLSAAEIDAALAAKGQDKLTGAALDQAKAIATQELIMAKSTDAQKAWANGSFDAIKKQNSLKATLDDLKATLAEKLQPAFQAVGDFIVTKLIPGFKSVSEAVREFYEDRIRPVINFLMEHKEILVGVAVAIAALLAPAFLLWAVGAAAAAISTIAALAPIIAIGIAIAALVAGIIWAYQNWGFFRDAVDAVASFLRDVLWPVIKTVADVIKDALIAQFQATIEVAQKVWEAIKTVADFLGPVLKAQIAVGVEGVKTLIGWFAAIIDAAVNVHNSATEKFEALVGFITGLPGRISSAASGMFDGIWDAFRGVYNSIADAWNNLSFELPSVDTKIPGIGTIGGFTIRPPFDIPRLASGAVASSPMLAMIGERGREIVAPDGLIRKIVREETAAGGATFNNTFNGTRVNARDVSDEIAWQLRGIL